MLRRCGARGAIQPKASVYCMGYLINAQQRTLVCVLLEVWKEGHRGGGGCEAAAERCAEEFAVTGNGDNPPTWCPATPKSVVTLPQIRAGPTF
jgi:hypothetical protein